MMNHLLLRLILGAASVLGSLGVCQLALSDGLAQEIGTAPAVEEIGATPASPDDVLKGPEGLRLRVIRLKEKVSFLKARLGAAIAAAESTIQDYARMREKGLADLQVLEKQIGSVNLIMTVEPFGVKVEDPIARAQVLEFEQSKDSLAEMIAQARGLQDRIAEVHAALLKQQSYLIEFELSLAAVDTRLGTMAGNSDPNDQRPVLEDIAIYVKDLEDSGAALASAVSRSSNLFGASGFGWDQSNTMKQTSNSTSTKWDPEAIFGKEAFK